MTAHYALSAALPGEWVRQAACRNEDPAIFFPERGHGTAAPAKAVCAACVVRGECLEFALETRQLYGIWGGLAEKERRKLRRERRRDDFYEWAERRGVA